MKDSSSDWRSFRGARHKIWAIGLNYADHIEESKMETPQRQVWFTKAQTSVNGPYNDIEIAKGTMTNDYV